MKAFLRRAAEAFVVYTVLYWIFNGPFAYIAHLRDGRYWMAVIDVAAYALAVSFIRDGNCQFAWSRK